ncbi:hypothetical protein HPP92_002377 [Vanilla planifolia]|uniref:Uncharacterized protein n=1 Tax=Vanilla planifolia TaxID=51239 RepID=A0A835S8F0_VANPL|nr:hypothetical protein HPP92_002377 [Vanilla planifolia]
MTIPRATTSSREALPMNYKRKPVKDWHAIIVQKLFMDVYARMKQKEGFGCSSSVPGGMFMRTSVADDVNRAALVAQYGSVIYDDGFNKNTGNLNLPEIMGHGLLLNSDPASNVNACLFPSGPP